MVLRSHRGLVSALALTALALAGALVLAVEDGLIFAFGDAPSHIVTARRVFENFDPSLAQLGTHWTPLFHVLQLPLVWADPLYESGASGIIVSALATLLSAASLYRLSRLVGVATPLALGAVAALCAQPAFILSGAMPMLPALVMAAMLTNVFYLTRWALRGSGLDLLLSAFWLTLAVLAHFETWILLPLELAIIAWTARARWGDRTRTEATLLLWAPLAGFGVFFFVYMNISIYGDPLAFLRPYAGTGDVVGSAHQGWGALADHPRAVLTLAGWPMVLLGLAGLAGYLRRQPPAAWVALLLLAPLAWFLLQAATIGSIIEPGDTLGYWRNLRYGVTMLPGLVFFAVAGPRSRWLAGTAVLVLLVVGVGKIASGQDGLWRDAQEDVPEHFLLQGAVGALAAHDDGGRVLMLPHDMRVDRFELYAAQRGLPMQRFLDANDAPWERIRSTGEVPPALGVSWLVRIHDTKGAFVPPRGFKLCATATPYRGGLPTVPTHVDFYRPSRLPCPFASLSVSP